MGSDTADVQEPPYLLRDVKVHFGMCKELWTLVCRISNIFPHIEAARPGGLPGIEALCLLKIAIGRAEEYVQMCCESSKLYLVITAEKIVSRFENTRNLLVQSLSKLEGMVPVALQLEISGILDNLRTAVFFVDYNEELAGKALIALLGKDQSPIESVGNTEVELLQFAASLLHLSSHKDLVTERRSLKRLLSKTGDSSKRGTLMYLMHILKKHDKLIVQGQASDPSTKDGEPYLSLKSDNKRVTTKSSDLYSRPVYAQHGTRSSIFHSPTPPEEYKCHLSSKLMYDPVIIKSGQTFERAYIQKWFDEDHDTCPKTGMKLSDLSVIPNTSMRDLISKWCTKHGVNVSDPSLPIADIDSLETSSNSICSSASSIKDLQLRIDMSNLSMSNISLGSLDNSYSNSNISSSMLENSFSSVKEVADADPNKFQFFHSIYDIKREFLSNISELPWESQCSAVRDVHNYLICNNPSCAFVTSENFLDPLLRFLHNALDKHDGEAQKDGNRLLLTFLKSSRIDKAHINEDVYALVASLLESEAATEALGIVELLSAQVGAIFHFAESGVLNSTIKLLDSHKREFQEAAVGILHQLSMSISASSCKIASGWIPKLISFLADGSFAGTCICILENLCKFEETRVAVAETSGCIAAIIELLERGSSEDAQEHAVGILLSLCTQRDYYCDLVLGEGAIPAIHHVSIHGNQRGKIIASELLRQLRDRYESEHDCVILDTSASECHLDSDEKPTRKSSSSGWKMKFFSKKK